MESVTVRQLRNHAREVLDRVARGEALVITRDGYEVAELRPRVRKTPAAEDLIARRRHLPKVDPDTFRRDPDSVLDAELWGVETHDRRTDEVGSHWLGSVQPTATAPGERR